MIGKQRIHFVVVLAGFEIGQVKLSWLVACFSLGTSYRSLPVSFGHKLPTGVGNLGANEHTAPPKWVENILFSLIFCRDKNFTSFRRNTATVI